MDSVAPGFIAAGGHHSSSTHSPDNQGFAFETAVPQTFDGHEERIEIQVEYGPVIHKTKYKSFYDLKYVIKNKAEAEAKDRLRAKEEAKKEAFCNLSE